MNALGGVVLATMTLIVLLHISQIEMNSPDRVLTFYFILICIADIYLNHIHDRFLWGAGAPHTPAAYGARWYAAPQE